MVALNHRFDLCELLKGFLLPEELERLASGHHEGEYTCQIEATPVDAGFFVGTITWRQLVKMLNVVQNDAQMFESSRLIQISAALMQESLRFSKSHDAFNRAFWAHQQKGELSL